MSTTARRTESTRKGGPVSRARYDALVARVEDLEDRLEMTEIDRAAASRGGKASPDALPDDLVGRLLNRDHPVDVWRAHRGYTLARLEALSGVPASYISEIVNSKKPGSTDALSRLATALDVSLEDLVELPEIAPVKPVVSQRPAYNSDTKRTWFLGAVKRDVVMIVISREALRNLSGKSDVDEAAAVKVTERNLTYLCKIAAGKYAAHTFDDGNILIGPDDLD